MLSDLLKCCMVYLAFDVFWIELLRNLWVTFKVIAYLSWIYMIYFDSKTFKKTCFRVTYFWKRYPKVPNILSPYYQFSYWTIIYIYILTVKFIKRKWPTGSWTTKSILQTLHKPPGKLKRQWRTCYTTIGETKVL